MITIKVSGKTDEEDEGQLKKCLEWIGYKVISIVSDDIEEKIG